jgi:glucokinase
MTCPVAVGVDVGGTKVLGLVVDFSGVGGPQVLEELNVPVTTSLAHEPDNLGEQVSALVERLVATTGEGSVPVGIGVAGYVDLQGAVVRSPNVPQAVGVDLRGAVRDRTGIQAVVDNDANCVATAALAWRKPVVTDLLAVTLGTGIGGGLVVGGHLLRGARGFAGEPGHMVIVPGGHPCVCGQRGCWERYASGTALGAMAADAFSTGRVQFGATPEVIPGGSGERLVAFARAGNSAATDVISEYSAHLAVGLANLMNLLDPELVVISGGVALALDVMLDHIMAELASNPTVAHRLPSVEVAPFADAAGAVGAATAAAGACQPGLTS